MIERLWRYAVVVFITGMVFLALHAEAPSRNTDSAVQVASGDAGTPSPDDDLLLRRTSNK
jgi:hypothetical protein